MRTPAASILFFAATLSMAALLVARAAPATEGCPDPLKWNASLQVCAPVFDGTSAARLDPSARDIPPNLELIRARATPTPNGVGVGVIYSVNHLRIASDADLQTWMDFHPNGINNLTGNYIFATATNRADGGVEVLGAYASGISNFTIYDWSCAPNNHCTNGNQGEKTHPDFVYLVTFGSIASCYKTSGSDTPGKGHTRNQLEYSNETKITAATNPPTWTNNVYLWNHCLLRWQLIYTHSFQTLWNDQTLVYFYPRDCSLYSDVCGWWGPIVERTIDAVQPNIHEVGFQDSKLFTDSLGWVTLTNSDTYFAPPEPMYEPTWQLWHQGSFPNYVWGAGYDTNE